MKVINILSETTELPKKLLYNAKYFREGMVDAGFDIVPGETAIVPVMLCDEPLTVKMAEMLLKKGIYVIGFSYPVVPRGKARSRIQLSAAHEKEDLDKAINAFTVVGRILGVCG